MDSFWGWLCNSYVILSQLWHWIPFKLGFFSCLIISAIIWFTGNRVLLIHLFTSLILLSLGQQLLVSESEDSELRTSQKSHHKKPTQKQKLSRGLIWFIWIFLVLCNPMKLVTTDGIFKFGANRHLEHPGQIKGI